jgi:hypothetical protein
MSKQQTVVAWVVKPGPKGQVVYLVDGQELGQGDTGFDQLLRHLADLPQGRVLIIRYPFWLTTGGGSFEDLLPYKTRVDELQRVIAERGLRVRYKAQF